MKITIEVDGQSKLETLMEWLRANNFLDEITVKSKTPDYMPTITKGDESIDPRALEGIWKDNPRTLEEIRRDACGAIDHDSLRYQYSDSLFQFRHVNNPCFRSDWT